jgi:hypothetical protein
LYTYVASISNAQVFHPSSFCMLQVFAFGCFKNRLGCCTCYNGVLTVCFKCFIRFRCMLQMFHLDVAKVDRDVARRSWWLSLLLGWSCGSIHMGFPVRDGGAWVPMTDTGAGAGAGCERGSGAGVGAVSGHDVPSGLLGARRSDSLAAFIV